MEYINRIHRRSFASDIIVNTALLLLTLIVFDIQHLSDYQNQHFIFICLLIKYINLKKKKKKTASALTEHAHNINVQHCVMMECIEAH